MTSDAASDITATSLSAYLCVGWVKRGRADDDVWGWEGSSLRETTRSWSLIARRDGVDVNLVGARCHVSQGDRRRGKQTLRLLPQECRLVLAS